MSDQTNIIILCPGQGAQQVGMGKAWAERYPVAADTFARADEVLGIELSKTCFEGPDDTLNRTDFAQAALYTCAVASFRGLCEEGAIDPANIVATAGLSLGEFTALHLAGAFDFETGLKLVRLRGQAMQDAAESVPSSMVALIRGDEEKATALCAAALEGHADEVLVPANFNAPGQVVISGSAAACERAATKAEEFEMVAKPLTVAGAFHSPIMQPAADRLAAALDEATWNTPNMPVVSNVTAEPHDNNDIESIKKRLVEQLTSPVRWADSMVWTINNIQGQFIEMAPNKVLGGLMKRVDRKTKVANNDQPPAVPAGS